MRRASSGLECGCMPDQENDQQRTDRPAVLVIDDEKAYTKVMAMVLGEYGFDSFPANSAEDAWELLGHITPDLVLLDVMMPEIDGITFSRRISCECGVPCGPGPGGYGIYRDP